jgi:hypothetical protein
MKVEILISDISKLSTRTRVDDAGLTTTLQFDAKVPVASLARILNLQRQGAPMLVAISSPQAVMDLSIQEDRGQQQESPLFEMEGEQERR